MQRIQSVSLTTFRTLESAKFDPSVSRFLQMALLTMGHVTCKLGILSTTLLAGRHQVWFAQAELPENCKRILWDLPLIPGHLFGPTGTVLLEKQVKLSEANRQLTQVQLNTVFKVPPVQSHHHYTTQDHHFHQHHTLQPKSSQGHRMAEDPRGFQPPQQQPGGPCQHPPTATKDCTLKS